MNEFNKTVFVEKWQRLLNFVAANNIPHFIDGQKLIIIDAFPSKVFSELEDVIFRNKVNEVKVLFEIHNEQFKIEKHHL